MTRPHSTSTDTEAALAVLPRFARARVLVVGDVMVDHYLWGSVERVSPEAPVPIVRVERDTHVLGGAANVAHNISRLGGQAFLAGVVGEDEMGVLVRQMLVRIGVEDRGLIPDLSRHTTEKARLIAHHHQVARYDREDTHALGADIAARLLRYLDEVLPLVDAVILSDYGKGVLTAEMVDTIVARAAALGKICSVDPKVRHFDLYRGTTIITPNHHEAGQAVGRKLNTIEEVEAASRELRALVGCQHVLVTFAANGMCLLEENGNFTHIKTQARQVFDVTGAGDTVISALTLALAAGALPVVAARIANAAAGVVVGEFGTATLTEEQLELALRESAR